MTCAYESYTEIVTGAAWQLGKSRAVSTVCVQPNSVVVAAGKSSSAARAAFGADRVSDRKVSFNVAVRGAE